jgi:hypothetical protein
MKTTTFVHLGILGVACVIAGCTASTEPSGSQGAEPAAQSAGAVATETPGSKKLLASIQKSDTDVIRFWEHERGVVQIEESGDIDRDLRGDAAGRGALLSTNVDGMSLVEAYKLLAGPSADEAAIATLAEVDGRLGKLTPATPSPRSGGENTGGPPASSDPSSQSGPKPMGLTQCQLTTQSWDWQNDIAWFKNRFCGNDSVTCFANANFWWVDSSAWYTYQDSWFHATGFEGSFCDSANFDFTLKVNFCDSSTIIYPDVFPLPPRNFNTQNWSVGGCVFRADWDARVNATLGGLDSQARLGLAVHRQ